MGGQAKEMPKNEDNIGNSTKDGRESTARLFLTTILIIATPLLSP
jgi:hypothetical protein